jgi:hypothetical protein
MTAMSDVPPPLPSREPVPVIDYDTPPRADHVRRSSFMLTLIIAAALGAILLGLLLTRMSSTPKVVIAPTPARATTPTVTPQQQIYQYRVQSGQSQLDDLLADNTPATTVVYEEDPARAATMKGQAGMQEADRQNMSQPIWGAFQPPIFRLAPFQQDHGGPASGMLFAHERVSPAGNRRLVLLEIVVKLETPNQKGQEADIRLGRQLKYRICETKLFATSPQVLRYGQSLAIEQTGDGANVIPIRWIDGSLRANRRISQNLRFFAGQVDPKDGSHFTVDYAVGKQSNTIDVYLTDDDFLRVIPRGGRIDGGTWRIDEKPTVNPPAEK